jgi:hypothetical protein
MTKNLGQSGLVLHFTFINMHSLVARGDRPNLSVTGSNASFVELSSSLRRRGAKN